MKKVFIAMSFSDRDKLEDEIVTMKNVFDKKGYESLVFVNEYIFSEGVTDKEMMDAALKNISEADILIAELSHKAIGVGLEVGYAKALNKRVIYVRKEGSEYSKTVGGVSDDIVEYSDIDDLSLKLLNISI